MSFQIEPSVVAELVDPLPTRVRNRTEKFLADKPWDQDGAVFSFENATVEIHADTITSAEQITCTCLLAPKCAHLASVALSLPVAEAPEPESGVQAAADVGAGTAQERAAGPDAPDTEAQDGELGTTPAQATDRQAPETQITQTQVEVAQHTWCHLADALLTGLDNPSLTTRATLAADLHLLRTHGLITAERAATSLLSSIQDQADCTGALVVLMRSLWGIQRGEVEAVGVARRRYREIGGMVLTPLCAEPIITRSGYGGAAVTMLGRGSTWQLVRTRPGAQPASTFNVGADWGGTVHSLAFWSRHQALVSHATASADGRLGNGKEVQVAAGQAAQMWEELPPGYTVVSGELSALPGDSTACRIGETTAHLSATALSRQADKGLRLLAHAGAEVRALLRGNTLLGVEPLDEKIQLPEEAFGVWWPGITPVSRNWVGSVAELAEVDAVSPDEWDAPLPQVAEVLDRWVGRVARAGLAALDNKYVEQDGAWLRRAGAPFAEQLLLGLRDARQVGHRAFDGSWCPDADAFARAWLVAASY